MNDPERAERVVGIIRDWAEKRHPGIPVEEAVGGRVTDLGTSVTMFCQRFSAFYSEAQIAHLYIVWPDMED